MTGNLGGARRIRRAGVATTGASLHKAGRIPYRVKLGAAAAAAAVSVGALGAWATTVGAAVAPVPSFPDNLVVFPDRDFVSVEGYERFGGQTALLEVTRPNVGVVGSATAVVSDSGVAFEVNHPGGVCWGNGTSLNVTPDILPGDVVSISVGGSVINATTVLDVQASDADLQADGVTMLVRGHIGPGVNPDNLEQRIIEPALRDTEIARRDIRAVPGPLTTAPRGGYASSLTVDTATQSFLATYVFDNPDTAVIAANAGLGERAMAWEVVDEAANRQGLTISEFGEPGGPGMGGCPNGPLQSGPVGPTNVTAALMSGGSAVEVHWTPAVAVAGTPAITGYEVTAVDRAAPNGQQVMIGRRIAGVASNTTTITGLDPAATYDVEVVSISSAGRTMPPVIASAQVDSVPPVVSANPHGGSYALAQQVTLSGNEPGVDIYYTVDGTEPVLVGGVLGDTANHYTAPIAVNENTTLKFAGFDPSGNVSDIVTETYTITNLPTAAAPTITSATGALQSVNLAWTAADPVAPATAITAYQVRVFDSNGSSSAIATVDLDGSTLSTTVTGLAGNRDYWFTVAAVNEINPAFGPESNRFGPVTTLGPVVANAGPDQLNVVRNTTVSLRGTGSSTGAEFTYLWQQVTDNTGLVPMTAANPNFRPLTGATSINASFTYPLHTRLLNNGPLYFMLTVTNTATTETRSDVVMVSPRNDTISITTARFKPGDFRLGGTGTIDGATVQVYTINANGTVSVWGNATVTAGAWTLRIRTGNPATNPGRVWAVSNQGGVAGPFTVTNG